MITKEQALTVSEFHYNGCTKETGPRGGLTYQIERWRRNGRTKTWKRSPNRFSVPIKYGLYSYEYLTDENAQYFHAAEECPIE